MRVIYCNPGLFATLDVPERVIADHPGPDSLASLFVVPLCSRIQTQLLHRQFCSSFCSVWQKHALAIRRWLCMSCRLKQGDCALSTVGVVPRCFLIVWVADDFRMRDIPLCFLHPAFRAAFLFGCV
jgi:hypothetical protein